MSQSREQAANPLQELTDSDLEAVSGGGSEGSSPAPGELAQLQAASQEFSLFMSAATKAIESAGRGAQTTTHP